MWSRADMHRASTHCAVALLAAVLLAACSTPSTQGKPARKQATKAVQPGRIDIQQDATGFTIL